MLKLIPILTCLLFASIYPLCFWISFSEPLKNNFHRFHLGISVFVGGIAVIALFLEPLSSVAKNLLLVWVLLLTSFSYLYWKKDYPNPFFLSLPCGLGMIVFAEIYQEFISPDKIQIMVSLLGGFILCTSIYAMNLGHWYLNVHGLPIRHLVRTVNVLGVLLLIRLIGDVYGLFIHELFFNGDLVPLYVFMGRMDGFLLWPALFFGTLFPFISLYFVQGTLKVKSTQSATGILYVILIAVLIGDLTYKYYLLKYGIAL